MGKRPAILIVFGLLLIGVASFSAKRSADYEAYLDNRDKVRMENNGFFIAHGAPREMNEWDYGSAGAGVLAASLVVAAVWLRKR